MSGRSAAEREAARIERERRRAERLAGTPPPRVVRQPAPARGPERFEPEPRAPEPPEPDPFGSEPPEPDPFGSEPPEPDPFGSEPPEPRPFEPKAGDGTPPDFDRDHFDRDRIDGDRLDRDPELPAGTRRVPRSRRTPPSGVRPAPGRRPPRTSKHRPHKSVSRPGRIVSLVALLLAGAAIWFLYELFQPFHGSGQRIVSVTIPAHSSASQVGDLLERDGIISSSFFFSLRATLAGERGDLRSGTYRLKQDMGYGDVLTALTTAPKPAKVSELTIIEGRTRSQIDLLLRSQHVRGSYLAATRRSRLLDPRAYRAPRSTPSLEGFLFPSTYQLRDPISIGALVTDQLQTFRKEFSSVSMSYARRKHLTPYDVLIIASMVQAEAQTEHDRPLIASVIYNRLKDAMPLQIDATTRYATGNYTSPLTVSQLNSSSPYNTRIHKGLTPTPIDNPGLASIQAAAHPSQTNYLYFVVKPCGNGAHVFSSNYAQFLRDAARYQTARKQHGGRSPSHC